MNEPKPTYQTQAHGHGQLYAVKSPTRGYFAPGGAVWTSDNHSVADVQAEQCERNEPGQGWEVVLLGRGGRMGPGEVKG